ncbi:MAG: hypothetical protein RIB03_10885 [Henriciella sp.]|uniref:hypothetical protein n=1 Tax=Henriciella sp. TaxID=1968823 RepID=UPI0026349D5C|nr:hypothetical protein [Henriciella sp.]
MKRVVIPAVAAMGVALMSAPATAQEPTVVTSVTEADLVRYAESLDHTVEETFDAGEGVPLLRVKAPDMTYFVYGNACEAGICKGIKLVSRYNADATVTPANVNKLNTQVPAVKLWYDDEEDVLAVERYLILDKGMAEENITFEMSTFHVITPRVIEMFGEFTEAGE